MPILPNSLEALQAELETALPEFEYRIKDMKVTRFLIAKQTNFRGAAIHLKKDRLAVNFVVPDTFSAFLIGSGAAYLRYFVKSALYSRDTVAEYLKENYGPVDVR